MKFLWQSLLLLASFLLIFAWEATPLNAYTIQAIGLLVFIFIILSASKRKESMKIGSLGSVFVLNIVMFLLIFSTGGLSSNLFFILYFLLFAISFVFDPSLAFIFVAGTVIVFLPEAFKNDVFANLIKIGSVAIISPLAYFFGKQFRGEEKSQEKVEAMEERAKAAADTISEDVDGVLVQEKEKLAPEDVAKLNDILEETEDLRAETKE